MVNTVEVTTTIPEENTANNTAALTTTVETPEPVLTLSPESLVFGVLTGTVSAQTVVISNTGGADLTGVEVIPQGNLPWVYLGTPSPLPDILPGGSQEFIVFVSPPDTVLTGTYTDSITISATGSLLTVVALTIEVVSEVTNRELVINVQDLDNSLITSTGTVILVSQEPTTITIEDVGVYTYYQQYRQQLDGSGVVTFTNMLPGDYSYIVRANGYIPDNGGSGCSRAEARSRKSCWWSLILSAITGTSFTWMTRT
jgi:hypothetical protein